MTRTAVLAVGGNALAPGHGRATLEEQQANANKIARLAVSMMKQGWRIVMTHGNGPQVGNLSLQQEGGAAAAMIPAQPLVVLGAMTQGQIGHMLTVALHNAAGGDPQTSAVLTHVLVDPRDPAIAKPTKPIGPFFSSQRARVLAAQRGWEIVDDAGRGFRRVVPSPEPVEILEGDAIRALVDKGFIVVAGGGGGIPVVRRGRRIEGFDAVIDKDLTAALLAATVDAQALLLLTGVDRVMLDFGKPTERPVKEMAASEARAHIEDGQFPPGSMGPKVAGALRFLEAGGRIPRGGRTAIITSARRAAAALAGKHGTRIVRDEPTPARRGAAARPLARADASSDGRDGPVRSRPAGRAS
jgi:carbamate kinase